MARGKSLAQILHDRGTRIPEREAVAYVRRAAHEVEKLHREGWHHGAITLHMISILPEGRVVLQGQPRRGVDAQQRAADVQELSRVLFQLLIGPHNGSAAKPECSPTIINALHLGFGRDVPCYDVSLWIEKLNVPTPLPPPPSAKSPSMPSAPPPVGQFVPIRRLNAGTGRFVEVAFAAEGKEVWTGTNEGQVQIWSAITGAQLASLDTRFKSGAVTSLAFAAVSNSSIEVATAETIASGHEDGRIRLWEARSNRMKKVWDAHSGPVCALTFAPLAAHAPTGLQNLASGGRDGMLHLWDTSDGHPLKKVREDSGNVRVVAASGRLVAAGCDGGRVEVWDTGTGAPAWCNEMHDFWVTALNFSSNGKLLASGAYDRSVRVWAVDSGIEMQTFSDLPAAITDLAFAPDNRLLAATCSDGHAFLWDSWSGTLISQFDDLGGSCHALAWSPGGRVLALAVDSQLLLWKREG
jgi:WD40 repeat protein